MRAGSAIVFGSRRAHLLRAWVALCVVGLVYALPGAAPASAASCIPGVVGQAAAFVSLSTPAEQCYLVPAGVTTVHVSVTGAGGANGAGSGGAGGVGATVVADVQVPAGVTTVYIEVGSRTGFNGGGAGGTGDNADSASPGGTGGGASDVRICPRATTAGACALTGTASDPRLIVAGGGGGGGGGVSGVTDPGVGGAAGYVGQGGGPAGNGGEAGGGGGTSGGGAGAAATPGRAGSGGSGEPLTSGGGGGGGWWGGGGASEAATISGAGGGGSSFGPTGAVFGVAPSNSFPASVVITPYAPSSSGTVGLSGTVGPAGPAGTQGPAGATGPAGESGEIELVTCTKVTKKVNGKTETSKRCTTKLTSSPQTFTENTARARVSRAGHVYATGLLRAGRLTLHAARTLRAGRYTLTLTTGTGNNKHKTSESFTVAQTITVS